MKAIKITSEVTLAGGFAVSNTIVVLHSFSGWTRDNQAMTATGMVYLSEDSYRNGNDPVFFDSKFGQTGQMMNVAIPVTEEMLENTTTPVITFMLTALSAKLADAKLSNELIDIT